MSYLIENQVIEGFSLQLESPLVYGAYTDALIALEAGKTYSISWDGVLYICTAIDVSAYGNPGDVALGDVNYVFGGESTGEPFAIGYGQGYADGVATGVFDNTWFSKTAESSHTVSVALYVEPEEEQEGIVLKDRNGDDVAYYGIETVTFDTTTEGKQQTYSKGVVAEGVEVTLALADGDQVIQAPDGYLVKEATIKKPETLLAENIAAGKSIAGVLGTFEGNLLEGVAVVPDFSNGDQVFVAPPGYGVKSGVLKKPETLVSENIAEGVRIAGITGTFAGAGNDEPVIFVVRSYQSKYTTSKGTQTISNSLEVPLNAKVLAVMQGFACTEQNFTMSQNYYNPAVTSFEPVFDYTLTEGSESAVVSLSKSYGGTLYYYKKAISEVLCAFCIDGAKYIQGDNGKILYLGKEVSFLPPVCSLLSVNKVDASNSMLTRIQKEMFKGQASLTEILLPASLSGIGDYAFSECSALVDVTLPENIESVGTSAFYNCGALKNLSANFLKPATIGAYAFKNCSKLETVAFTGQLTSIGEEAFYSNSSLEQITLPDSVTSIGENAFSYSGLKTVNVPKGVTDLGINAFASAQKLETVDFHEELSSIGSYAFNYCSALAGVAIPNSVTSIGNYAFSRCTSLGSIVVPENVAGVGIGAFSSCTSLVSVQLPSGLTTLESSLFSGCSALTTVNIPSGVTILNYAVFRGCKNLANIAIPSAVTEIATYVFQECTALTSITIPSGVTSIGNYAFNKCSELTNVDLSAVTQVPTLGTNNFNSPPDGFTITVPASLYDDFIAATNWSALADYIVAAS